MAKKPTKKPDSEIVRVRKELRKFGVPWTVNAADLNKALNRLVETKQISIADGLKYQTHWRKHQAIWHKSQRPAAKVVAKKKPAPKQEKFVPNWDAVGRVRAAMERAGYIVPTYISQVAILQDTLRFLINHGRITMEDSAMFITHWRQNLAKSLAQEAMDENSRLQNALEQALAPPKAGRALVPPGIAGNIISAVTRLLSAARAYARHEEMGPWETRETAALELRKAAVWCAKVRETLPPSVSAALNVRFVDRVRQ